jgi:NAD(P)-dependent dehydrogenase (short-subunit alcohol dehydrogenase family)
MLYADRCIWHNRRHLPSGYGAGRQGATIVLVCRTVDQGEALRMEIAAATGNQSVQALSADLSDQSTIRRLATEFQARFPPPPPCIS